MVSTNLVQINSTDIYYLLISCFTWSTFYFTLCLLNPKRSYEWHIRTVTLIHAVIVSVLGMFGAFVLGPWPFTNSGGSSSPYQHFVITISLAYFLLDFSWCIYFQTEGPVMLVHHCMSIAGLAVCFLLKYYGIEMITTLFGSEITNPLLQTRWFLKETNRYDSKLGDVVDVAFMSLFGFFRIFLGTILLVSYFGQSGTDWLGKLAGVLIYSMGWVFWISIVQYGFKKYKRKYGSTAGSQSEKSCKVKKLNNNKNTNNDSSDSIKSTGSVNGHLNGHIGDCRNGVAGNISQTDLRQRVPNNTTISHSNGNTVIH